MTLYLKIITIILMMFGVSFSQTQPDLTVLFDQFDSTVTVYVDGDEIVIEADGVPSHLSPYFVQTYNQSNNGFYFWEDTDGDFVNDLWMATPSDMNLNPNRIGGQNYEFRVPLHPAINPNGPSDTFLGPIGASINGVPFFNEYESPTQTITNQVIQSFDPGNGHPAPQGRYHYHFPPESLYTVTEDNFLGFAADGFPVYGPKNPDSTNAQNLDDYHGEYGPTPDFPDSIYHYHTNFNTPYIIGAFAGTIGTGFGGGGGGGGGDPPDCDEVPPGAPCCGDGICGGPENENNCPEDCGVQIDGPWAWVSDGYQSGVYVPGDTVHVWSALDPSTMTFQEWTGDTSLLNDFNEWHTSFIMPDSDVHFYSQHDSVELLDFEYETITGVENPKNVYSTFPEDPIGTIFFFHGGSGNADDVKDRTEVVQFIQDAVATGYGVIFTDSEDRTLNDVNNDGNTQWLLNPWTVSGNVDIGNIQIIHQEFISRNVITESQPVFAVGASNGGNFASVVSYALEFNAVAIYSAQGNPPALYEATTTPTIFCPAKNDPALGGGNWVARMNFDTLQARGIPSQFYELESSPAYRERFMRIEGIDSTISADLITEFNDYGLIDSMNFFTVLDDSVQSLFLSNPASFPVFGGITLSLKRHVLDQIKVMTADHSFFADFNKRVLAYFNLYSGDLSTEKSEIIPNKIVLYPAYPNPFNPTTTIRFNIGEGNGIMRTLRLNIYDINGRLVEILINKKLEPGTHEVQWNAQHQSSGVYFSELISGDVRKIRKMILLK